MRPQSRANFYISTVLEDASIAPDVLRGLNFSQLAPGLVV
jgi:hypothetical protein